jgi:hypothetical protein
MKLWIESNGDKSNAAKKQGIAVFKIGKKT